MTTQQERTSGAGLTGGATGRRGSHYAELSRRIKQAGLLDRRRGRYAATIAVVVGLLVAGLAAFVLLGDSWWQLSVAAFLSVVFTHLGFLGHDAGHRQIFASRRANDSLGLVVGNLLIGMSFSWWVGKHNRHHRHPNQVDADPDVGAGVLAWTPEQAAARGGFGRAMARHQGYLFFPLLLLEGLNLHVASLRAMFAGAGRRHLTEAVLLAAHFAGGLTLLLLVLSPLRAVVFLIVQQGLFGLYLGCSFAPNHKGMPMLGADTHLDFLRRQLLTSRNVRPGRVTDIALGGLNYQIEHHLFPSMPRPNLRRCRPLVRSFCSERGLPYCDASALSSYVQALRYLNRVGAAQPLITV
ncbi:MAG: fatty acid desaturase family protein [Frankiaceae bacterium]